MNYLVAVDKFFVDRFSGSARVAWDIAKVIRDRGHNTTIFCRRQTLDAPDVSYYEGIRIVRFDFPKTRSLDPFKMQKQIKAGTLAAQKYLSATRWDVIHAHQPLYAKIVFDLFNKCTRLITTVHSPVMLEQEVIWSKKGIPGKIKLIFGKKVLRKLEGDILKKSSKIHTLSNFTKSKIQSFHSNISEKIVVIPHWCREDFVRKNDKDKARQILGWPVNGKIIFTVRRFIYRMGLDIAIRAIEEILKTNENAYFMIAGTGDLENDLKKLTDELGLTKKVCFLGRVSDEELKNCYEASDMFVLPTRALECFGLPVIEAMSYGLPLITTDAAATPELMSPIMPDYIAKADSVDSLKEKFTMFFKNEEKTPSQEELMNFVFHAYGKDIIVPQIINLIEGS